MAVPIDTTQPLLRPSQLEALVRAVRVADVHDEHDWIEWKNTLDFTTADDKWHVAKQILGFANRPVVTAQRHAGGYAYLLIGVEPGALAGVASIDNADFTNAIERYVGPANWSLEQVQVEGKKVVIVIVEPPKPGDDPLTLRKAYRNFPEGAIFVRSPGRTGPASPVQVQALVERAKATREKLDISVRAAPATIEFGPSLDDNRIDEIIAEERSALMAPKRSRRPAPHSLSYLGLVGEPYSSIASAVSSLRAFAGERPDERSESDYAQEVETYLDELREALNPHHLHERYKRPGASLQLVVDNPTERNFRRLHVVVHVEGDVRRWEEDPVDELYRADELPIPPRPLGTPTKAPDPYFTSLIHTALPPNRIETWPPMNSGPGFSIENTGSVSINFDPVDVRPRTPVRLPKVELIVFEPVGTSLQVAWEATAENVDGLRSNVIEVVVVEQAAYLGPSARGDVAASK